MRTLSARGAAWLDDMPPYYRDDPFVQGVVDALAREYDRVEAAAVALLTDSFAQNASDTYRLLAIWEAQLGLAVEPKGQTVATRQALVLARLKQRKAGTEQSFRQAMDRFLGGLWSYSTNFTTGTLTIRLAGPATTFTADQVLRFARQLVPAHLALAFAYSDGFVLDSTPMDSGAF